MFIAEISAETLKAVRDAQSGGGQPVLDLRKDATTQGMSQATSVMGYNLEAPSKKLFPWAAPLRKRFPRTGGQFGNAVNWLAIIAINAAKLKPGVAEGLRNAALSTSTSPRLAAFKSIGYDDFTTDEAQWAGRRFEDVKALSVANTLTSLMVGEEALILGGNVTAIGKPAATGFTAVDSANAGPFTATTAYDFAVSALTLYGYQNGATGRATGNSIDETDARTLTTFTTGSAKTAVTLAWPAVRGAVAYNVFIGVHSGTLYYAFTTTQTKITIDSTVLAALPGAGNVANNADQTADALSFDGLIPQIALAGSGSYFKDLQGAALTPDNAGGIVEWDTALKAIWDASLLGPTLILVSSQEAGNALKKIAANGSTTVLRLNAQVGADGAVTGGLYLGSYLNKYTQQSIEIMTHPKMPPGMTIFLSEKLPYPQNNVPNVIDMAVRQEYTQYDWARTQRKDEYGVYASEVLRLFFPAGQGLLVGGSNG